MITISSGHGVDYLTNAVAGGRENYYSQAVAAGEPPGRWYGRGAAALGLHGQVDPDAIRVVYHRFADPRDPRFADPATRDEAVRLPGLRPYQYAGPEEAYAAALEREPDATAERRAQLRLQAEKGTRQAVAFHDVTFSVQKSVTVLHTAFEAQEVAARRAGDEEQAQAWSAHRQAVETAIWAGNRAAMEFLSDVAGYTRVGHHGSNGGRFADAHDWTVAGFFQHTSRSNDPQLHIHNAVLNRVECADGRWRTVDSRALHRWRGAAGAVAERTTEEYLSRALGVRLAMRPDGKAREVLGIAPEVLELFSARRRAITDRTRQLVEVFEQRYGRAPNTLELDRLQRTATFATRPAKQTGPEAEQLQARLDRWSAQLRAEVDQSMAQVAQGALGRAGQPATERFNPRAVIAVALADVEASKAAWHRGDLLRAVNAALPDNLGGLEPGEVRQLLEKLTDDALRTAAGGDLSPGEASPHGVRSLTRQVEVTPPVELTLADGRSAYRPPGGRLYATGRQLAAEQALRQAAVVRGRARVAGDAAGEALARYQAATGMALGQDQAAAVRGVLTSGAAVEVLVGPAGAGKSAAVGALAAAWIDPYTWPDRAAAPKVVGLTTSQIAAEVLAGDGLPATNLAAWQATQQRLAAGRATSGDEAWQLAAGDLVVVDEASMADTAAVLEVHRRVEAAGAKLLLTGDHRQLAAVGANGAFDLVAGKAATYELVEARRFTHAWEREASLRLRDGDPDAVLTYQQRGRLLDGGTVEQATAAATRAWLADHLDGSDTLLLVETNEQAATASAQIRAALVRYGRVAEPGVPLEREGTRAGVGDLIAARRNAPQLAGWQGNPRGPVNRERFRVIETRHDGALLVEPVDPRTTDAAGGGRLVLPARYVREHVTLGYAATVHAAQGVTVDRCHSVITPATTAAGAYVGLTRGREHNAAHVVTVATAPDAPGGEAQQLQRRSPAAVLADVLDRGEPAPAALVAAEQSAEQAASIATVVGVQLAEAATLLAQRRHAAVFDRLAAAGVLDEQDRTRLAADPSGPALAQLLRTVEVAGHDSQQAMAEALSGGSLDGARSVAQVLHHRIEQHYAGRLTPVGDRWADRLPSAPVAGGWAAYVDRLGELADRRQDELGARVAEQAPQWGVEAFGPPPVAETDPAVRELWVQRAGVVAAYRELVGHDDVAQPVGPAPARGSVEARGAWYAAWRALGRPQATAEEVELSDGALQARVMGRQREEAWAPPWVGDDLAATAQAIDRYRQSAALARADADTTADPAERDTALARAQQAAALVGTLQEQQQRLELAAEARGGWYAHTAETRAAAQRATAELARRGVAFDTGPAEHADAHTYLHDAEAEAGPVLVDADVVEDSTERQQRQAATTAFDPPADHTTDAAMALAGEQDGAAQPPATEPRVPAGLPTTAATAATVLQAHAALAQLADRASAETLRLADEDTEQALATRAADQQRQQEQAAAEAEEVAPDALGRG